MAVSDDRNVSLVEIKLLPKGGGGQDWKGMAEALVPPSNNCFKSKTNKKARLASYTTKAVYIYFAV